MYNGVVNPKRALISVSDKAGIVEFCKELVANGVEIISTGGTAKLLSANNIPNIEISDYTGFPEMMDGRVKTLHPKIHGGILGLREEHLEVANAHDIGWIDIVVCNLYPFQATTKKSNVEYSEIIENIDIGGPSMIRSASKNFQYTTVVVEPSDYTVIIEELSKGGIEYQTRKNLAIKAFGHTAKYDSFIFDYLSKENSDQEFPQDLTLNYQKAYDLRYGENPAQKSAIYKDPNTISPILSAKIHQGIELSYNNILDCEAGFQIVKQFSEPTCVVIKHTNPCGVATNNDITEAFTKAYNADALSAFGGIIALNRDCNEEIATAISKVFAEIVIATGFDEKALQILSKKKKLRLLSIPDMTSSEPVTEYKSFQGGLLVQESNQLEIKLENLELKTTTKASSSDLTTSLFGWKVLKHVKSNGILLAKNNVTVGIGMGQVSRVDAVELAIRKAGDSIKDCVLLSDAFFPFRDSIDMIAKQGVKVIIQPGGSMRDQEVIDACNENGIAMYFTGNRCFKH
jgi:phosphoribosylaminoimidazolecarboxamide formyltransferase / IMP cyclohydrolase